LIVKPANDPNKMAGVKPNIEKNKNVNSLTMKKGTGGGKGYLDGNTPSPGAPGGRRDHGLDELNVVTRAPLTALFEGEEKASQKRTLEGGEQSSG